MRGLASFSQRALKKGPRLYPEMVPARVRIKVGSLLRHDAHHLGAWLAGFFPLARSGNPANLL
jgi:hypothetical protein